MNKFIYFMAVGLAFTALQVTTVGADDAMLPGMPGGPCDPGPACVENCCPADMTKMPTPDQQQHDPQGQQHPPTGGEPMCFDPAQGEIPCSAMPGAGDSGPPPMSMPPMGDHPPGEDCANKPTPEETAACWDQQGGHMDHPGDHPPGEHHDGPGGMKHMPPAMDMPPTDMPPTDMSSLGDHCGAIQAKNEKKKMRKEVKCLRRALHEHKPTVKLRQTKDGLGAYGCGVKKTGSKTAQIACLRGLLDAPSGTPGMAPGTN